MPQGKGHCKNNCLWGTGPTYPGGGLASLVLSNQKHKICNDLINAYHNNVEKEYTREYTTCLEELEESLEMPKENLLPPLLAITGTIKAP